MRKVIRMVAIFSCLMSSAAFAAPLLTNGIAYCPAVPTLQMNIAQPANMVVGQSYPTIMFTHGGGWKSGDRSLFQNKIEQVAALGYIGATISYRLTSPAGTITNVYTDPLYKVGAQGYDIVHDVKCALLFLKQNAAQYQIDPLKIGVTGASAGGHLTLMVGLSNDDLFNQSLGFPANTDLSVAAIASWHGPTSDLPNLEVITQVLTAEQFLGCTYDAVNNSWIEPAASLTRPDGTGVSCITADKELMPLTYIDANDPPLFILQGGLDTQVDKSQSIKLNNKAKGVHSFRFIPNVGHETTVQGWAEVMTFFDIHLKSVVDSSKPVITPPANITIAANGANTLATSSPEIVAFLQDVSAFDNAGIVGGIRNNAPATFPLGTTVVTFSATDQAGFTGSANASLTFGASATSAGSGGCISSPLTVSLMLPLLLFGLIRSKQS